MLSKKVTEYLQENADRTLPETREKYIKSLNNVGVNPELNSSFIEFMANYSDEYYGSEGLLHDVMQNDLTDYENGISKHFAETYGVQNKYISLFNLEVDDYLFYNIEDDSVKLIEAENINKLSEDKYYDKRWDSFNEFLEDFFGLN